MYLPPYEARGHVKGKYVMVTGDTAKKAGLLFYEKYKQDPFVIISNENINEVLRKYETKK